MDDRPGVRPSVCPLGFKNCGLRWALRGGEWLSRGHFGGSGEQPGPHTLGWDVMGLENGMLAGRSRRKRGALRTIGEDDRGQSAWCSSVRASPGHFVGSGDEPVHASQRNQSPPPSPCTPHNQRTEPLLGAAAIPVPIYFIYVHIVSYLRLSGWGPWLELLPPVLVLIQKDELQIQG